MNDRQLSDRWHDSSTNLAERYEMSLRGARGVVVRQRNDVVGYSAYMGYAGRQQWAEQLFDDMQDAQNPVHHRPLHTAGAKPATARDHRHTARK